MQTRSSVTVRFGKQVGLLPQSPVGLMAQPSQSPKRYIIPVRRLKTIFKDGVAPYLTLVLLLGPVFGANVSQARRLAVPRVAPKASLLAASALPKISGPKAFTARSDNLERAEIAQRLWGLPPDLLSEEDAHPFVRQVGRNIREQLARMAAISHPMEHELLGSIGHAARGSLAGINAHLMNGAIDSQAGLRLHEKDVESFPKKERELAVGIYPVAADPLHWGHLLIGLQAIASLKLDKVVFVLAGDDPRKPQITPVARRHPIGRAVLGIFSPFFAYSSIAVGTELDGETNLFRLLALNAAQRLRAYYMAGGDHYRLKDADGHDDTIPKIEKNMDRPDLKFWADKHNISLAFIARGGRREEVPTALDVNFLPAIPFAASSTHARAGRHVLMPHKVYETVQQQRLRLYGIAPRGD